MKRIDLTGKTFGRLTVLELSQEKISRSRAWLCRCECGTEKLIRSAQLRSGDTQSCGCFNVERRKERFTRHGGYKTPEYKSWQSMKIRCQNPNNHGYARYGAVGISVCERWQVFENFLADMGPRPAGTSIDRYPDGSGNYEPGNCRWATAGEQTLNKKPKKPVSEWRSLPTGRPKGTGWSAEERTRRMGTT